MKNKKEELTRLICREKRKSAYMATIGIIALFASIMLITVSGVLSIASAMIASLAMLLVDSVQDQKKLDDAYHQLRELED